MKIKLRSALDVRDGYGYIGQELALALDSLGHEVYVEPIAAWYSEDQIKPRIKELCTPISSIDFELIIMYPVHNFERIYKNAGILTMYEAHRCPSAWTQRLNQLKLPVYAPSEFVRQMFIDSGVKVPVHHLPLGIDTKFYVHLDRQFPSKRPFRFLTIGKMEPRKNLIATVNAFAHLFGNNPDYELIIKTRENFLNTSAKIVITKNKNIKVLEKTLTEEELRKLYYLCDCFVYPSRGEGFAFPPRNAIATGMPTMVTCWSALQEIQGAQPIMIKGLSPMHPCGFSYGEEKNLLMADIDEESLRNSMLMLTDPVIYNNWCKNMKTFKQMSWQGCAKKLVGMIEK